MPKSERIKKKSWKPGNMLAPIPAVLVSCRAAEGATPNLITIAWVGNVCSDPPMLSISVRPERYSYDILQATREFVGTSPPFSRRERRTGAGWFPAARRTSSPPRG
jgi:flavin reductase (DIM6/NTAB) family NADH-FMN oxidoreductase RutF